MNPVDLLGKIIGVSHSNLEITSRLNTILNILNQAMDFDEAIIFTSDQDKRLSCRYKNQKSGLYKVLSNYRCHVGEGIIGSVAQKRIPQYFSSGDIPPRFGCLFYPELDGIIYKYKGFVFHPLSDDSYIYGVLVLCTKSRHIPADSERILLSIISREIGGVLRMNELIISSKKRISELATLSELGRLLTSNMEPQALLKDIGLIIARSLNVIFVTIKLEHAFLKLDGQRFTYGDIDPSLMVYVEDLEEEAMRKKRALFFGSRFREEDELILKYSVYTTPIMSKSRILGTVTICGKRSQKDFNVEENGIYLISTIANYITNGLENTLLNTKLKDVISDLNYAQKRLIEQEKFRSLGEMTANIAHEIKNPLVIIGGFAKRLSRKINSSQSEGRYVDIITKEVGRLESILNDVLNYVKENPVLVDASDINECIDEILYLFSSDTSWENVHIVKNMDSEAPEVVCDIQQVKQVFINIMLNANEAMDGSGTITIKTTQDVFDNKRCVVVSINDTGGGIDPYAIDNIFNPFFTTKEKGTGLGLAISNKIIMHHGGKIDIENVVGSGATFFIYLPIKIQTSREELS